MSLHRNPWARTATGVVLIAAAFTAACAPRAVPVTYPQTSAASPYATPAPSATVSAALTTDPPLPGEPTTGWLGLAADDDRAGAEGPADAAVGRGVADAPHEAPATSTDHGREETHAR